MSQGASGPRAEESSVESMEEKETKTKQNQLSEFVIVIVLENTICWGDFVVLEMFSGSCVIFREHLLKLWAVEVDLRPVRDGSSEQNRRNPGRKKGEELGGSHQHRSNQAQAI